MADESIGVTMNDILTQLKHERKITVVIMIAIVALAGLIQWMSGASIPDVESPARSTTTKETVDEI